MNTTHELAEAQQFFIDSAPWSYSPDTETPEVGQRRSAIRLAFAEEWVKQSGVQFEWGSDWDVGSHRDFYGPDSVYADGEPSTCEGCMAIDEDGTVLASLMCIDDATDEVRRVVEAELALEAMSHICNTYVTPA